MEFEAYLEAITDAVERCPSKAVGAEPRKTEPIPFIRSGVIIKAAAARAALFIDLLQHNGAPN